MKPSLPGPRPSLPEVGVAGKGGLTRLPAPACGTYVGSSGGNALIAQHQLRDVRAHEKVTIHIVEGRAHDVYPRSNPA
jgi:hypothetical protein